MIDIFFAFVLAFALATLLFLFAVRKLNKHVRVAGIASYMLAYWAAWLIGAPWWSPASGALVGLLIGKYSQQRLICQQLGGKQQPAKSLLTYAHIVTAVWLATCFWHMGSVVSTASAALTEGAQSRMEMFALRGDAAQFVVKNYVPCLAPIVVSSGSRTPGNLSLIRNSQLTCHAQAVEVAAVQKGPDFAKRVSGAIDDWIQLQSQFSPAELEALAAVSALSK